MNYKEVIKSRVSNFNKNHYGLPVPIMKNLTNQLETKKKETVSNLNEYYSQVEADYNAGKLDEEDYNLVPKREEYETMIGQQMIDDPSYEISLIVFNETMNTTHLTIENVTGQDIIDFNKRMNDIIGDKFGNIDFSLKLEGKTIFPLVGEELENIHSTFQASDERLIGDIFEQLKNEMKVAVLNFLYKNSNRYMGNISGNQVFNYIELGNIIKNFDFRSRMEILDLLVKAKEISSNVTFTASATVKSKYESIIDKKEQCVFYNGSIVFNDITWEFENFISMQYFINQKTFLDFLEDDERAEEFSKVKVG